MVDVKSGPVELVQGIVDEVLGKTKQVVGIIINNDQLVEQGKAQQDKAEARRDAGTGGGSEKRRRCHGGSARATCKRRSRRLRLEVDGPYPGFRRSPPLRRAKR